MQYTYVRRIFIYWSLTLCYMDVILKLLFNTFDSLMFKVKNFNYFFAKKLKLTEFTKLYSNPFNKLWIIYYVISINQTFQSVAHQQHLILTLFSELLNLDFGRNFDYFVTLVNTFFLCFFLDSFCIIFINFFLNFVFILLFYAWWRCFIISFFIFIVNPDI